MSAVPVRSRLVTRRGTPTAIACAIALVVLCVAGPSAQLPLQPASPFDITGFIQACTLDTPGDVLSGGTVTVNNHVITVPRNTIFQMPAAALTWEQLWEQAPAPYAGTSYTGLAMTDVPVPPVKYEIHVQGNRVGDTYIAGLIFISQHSLMVGEGFINYIDYDRAEMRVGGVIGSATTGARVQLNDPLGRFGIARSMDPRFTIDEENPTVRSETGYPMCLPRKDPTVGSDALCPQGNRRKDPATGLYLTTFTMPPHTAGSLPDPYLMLPFEVGDYIDYNGVLYTDATGPYVSAWGIIANVGVYTTQGTLPNYVAIDVMLLGVGKNTTLLAEGTTRTRVEGFTTDPSKNVGIFAMDVNPVSGSITDRAWIDSSFLPVVVPIDQGPPTGAVLGRWRFRPGKAGFFLPPSREIHAISQGGQLLLPNGLLSGQYHAPNFEFIFAENLLAGGPPVPLNLEDFPFLAQGSGPLNAGGPIVGQLAAWPGAVAPATGGGAPVAPVANAGVAQTVVGGATVTLDGTQSFDPNGGVLTFAWTQTAGPAVTLTTPGSATASFVAPIPAATTKLTFALLVTNAAGFSNTAFATVTVNPPAPPKAPVANAGAAQTINSNLHVELNGTASSDPNTPKLPDTYAWVQTATGGLPAVVLTNATSSIASFTAPINNTGRTVALTFRLTVTNAIGSSTATATVNVNTIQAPLSNPGPDQFVGWNKLVTLDGSLSSDPNNLPLTYSWQAGGVVLTGATTLHPTFTTPNTNTKISVNLVVSNGFKSTTSPKPVSINVIQSDVVTIATAVYRVAQARLKVTASSSVAGATLTLSFFNPQTGQIQTAPMLLVSPGPGLPPIPTADVGGVPEPPSVTVTSSISGVATSAITRVQ